MGKLTEPRIDHACVVIPSCDAYSDLWSIVPNQLGLMWPNCSLSKFIVVNHAAPRISGVTPLAVGLDAGWSANLKRALARIPHTYVFLLVDDLFLKKRVNNQEVERLMLWAMSNSARYLRFRPLTAVPGRGDLPVALDSDTPYRASTVMSFWCKDTLRNLLNDGENAWQFEVRGTMRARTLDGFFATVRDYFPHYNLVVKRSFRRRAARMLAESGYEVEPGRRQVMSLRADAAETLREWRASAFKRFPRKLQIELRRLLMPDGRFDRLDRRRVS